MNESVTLERAFAFSRTSKPIADEIVTNTICADRGERLPAIHSMATGTPDGSVCQQAAGLFVSRLPHLHRHADGIERLYRNTRIDTRRLALDVLTDEAVSLCERSGTLAERTALYMHHAVPLATRVAREALVAAASDDGDTDVIIHSLFGDGCAAVVVGSAGRGGDADTGKILMHDHLSYLIDETEDGIVLNVTENGITCGLARDLPAYIESGISDIIWNFLARNDRVKADIDLWAVHPGGTRIIENARSSLGLSDDQVAASWSVLRDYGNMLSPAVLFVIERMMGERALRPRACDKPATGLAFSFAPGLGVEGLLFEAR